MASVRRLSSHSLLIGIAILPLRTTQTVILSTFFARRWLLAGLLAGGLIAAPLTSAETLPDLGDVADAVVSEPQERAIGKRIMQEVRADRSFVDDPEISGYITALGNRLVAASQGSTNDNRRDFEFFVLNDDSINAFALLGGFVGFHSGLMLTTQNESELAGVMGHEIAHILQRHQARGADGQRKSAPIALLGLALAIAASQSKSTSSTQATEAAIYGSQALAIQNQLDYSRDFEREADRLGLLVMQRAGFDVRGMASFFERMQRANRHNDGKAPGYLRSHPLTTERIADIQNRIDSMQVDNKRVIDSSEYRLAQAKLRVLSMSNAEAITFFRNAVAERSVFQNRAEMYGLTLAQLRVRDFAAAEKSLALLRASGNKHAWIENLAAEVYVAQQKWPQAIATYKDAIKAFPQHKALYYGLIEAQYAMGDVDAALAAAKTRLASINDDARLYELAAKGYDLKNKRLAQHRALGEAYYLRDNLVGAVEQLRIALRAKDGDFYESSSTESRLREFKIAYKNRPMLPGEKRDRERDRDDPEDRDNEPDKGKSRDPSPRRANAVAITGRDLH